MKLMILNDGVTIENLLKRSERGNGLFPCRFHCIIGKLFCQLGGVEGTVFIPALMAESVESLIGGFEGFFDIGNVGKLSI